MSTPSKSTNNMLSIICIPLVFVGSVCQPVTLGREQPGSPTPLLHYWKKSGRNGRGLLVCEHDAMYITCQLLTISMTVVT